MQLQYTVKNTFIDDFGIPGPPPLCVVQSAPSRSEYCAAFTDDEQPKSHVVESMTNNQFLRSSLTDEVVLSNVCECARSEDGSKHLRDMIKCNRSIDEICEKLLPNATKLAKDHNASEVLLTIFAYPNDCSFRAEARQTERKSAVAQKKRRTAPDWLMGHKRRLAEALLEDVHVLVTDMEACRVIEEVIANVEDNQILLRLIASFRNTVIKLIKDKHANYVIQRIFKSLPKDWISFMIIEMEEKVEEIARHICGCRALQRLLERDDCKDLLDKILEKIMIVIGSLISHRYGNYVVQHILEWGSVQHRKEVFKVVLSRPVEFSMGQFSSNIVVKCLKIAYEEKPGEMPNSKIQKLGDELVHKLIVGSQGDSSPIITMMDNRYGNYIVQRVIDCSTGNDKDILFNMLDEETERPGPTKNGNRRVRKHYKKVQENIEKSLLLRQHKICNG